MTDLRPQTGPLWTLTVVPYQHPEARRLTQALYREQLALYGFADDPADTPDTDFTAPEGTFILASAGDDPALGCGGWRTAGPRTGEIKRMYVTPAARGRGLGRLILQVLQEDAARRGMTEMILETGARNTAALGLYARSGYISARPYGKDRDPGINRAMRRGLPAGGLTGARPRYLGGLPYAGLPLRTGGPPARYRAGRRKHHGGRPAAANGQLAG